VRWFSEVGEELRKWSKGGSYKLPRGEMGLKAKEGGLGKKSRREGGREKEKVGVGDQTDAVGLTELMESSFRSKIYSFATIFFIFSGCIRTATRDR